MHPIGSTTCVIPARYRGSTRLSDKPSKLGPDGRTLLATVHANAVAAGFQRVLVATDRPQTARMDLLGASDSVAAGPAATIIETSDDCPNGTARCWQALQRQGMNPERIVNLQVDEPDVGPNYLRALVLAHAAHGHPTHTLAQAAGQDSPATHRTEPPSTVWVTLPRLGNTYALGWSRGTHGLSPTQLAENPGVAMTEIEPEGAPGGLPLIGFAIHVGVYSFTNAALRYAVSLMDNPLDGPQQSIGLEQLHWQVSGLRMGVEVIDVEQDGCPPRLRSINTPTDLAVWQAGGLQLEGQP